MGIQNPPRSPGLTKLNVKGMMRDCLAAAAQPKLGAAVRGKFLRALDF